VTHAVVEAGGAGVGDLGEVGDALRAWAVEGGPVQLHPGDLGWHRRFGAEATAAAVRTWRRGGRIVVAGLLDGPDVLRLALAPDVVRDQELARRVVEDLDRPDRAVGCVEVRSGLALRAALLGAGWIDDEPWTPLHRDLTSPVEDCGLRIEVVQAESAGARAAVQRAAFERSTFTADRWRAMAAGPAYRDARCLMARDGAGEAVATATVWSAGPGRPGLIEPLGVHHDHRGHGYGRAMTLAAAAALRSLGSSSATVCTRTANTAAVATYRSAGMRELLAVLDLRRVG
jgi:ribosomal protein S18 acetylase RimI-like enzyme